MERLLTCLFLTCIAVSVAAAQTGGGEANVPRTSPAPQPLIIKPPDSNATDMPQRATGQIERPRYKKVIQPPKEQPSAAQEKQPRRFEAVESQLAAEYQKYKYRIAVLNRIRQLAEENNFTDKIQKVDNLIKMENSRHRKKIMRIQRPVRTPSKAIEPNQQKQTR